MVSVELHIDAHILIVNWVNTMHIVCALLKLQWDMMEKLYILHRIPDTQAKATYFFAQKEDENPWKKVIYFYCLLIDIEARAQKLSWMTWSEKQFLSNIIRVILHSHERRMRIDLGSCLKLKSENNCYLISGQFYPEMILHVQGIRKVTTLANYFGENYLIQPKI